MVSQVGLSFGSRRDIYDGETGIYARWYFEQRLNEECSRARRQGDPITIVCLGVDDKSALTAGYRLRKHVRDYDLIGRIARTRFVVAALDAGPETADVICERLRTTIGVGSDVGLAWFPEDAENAQQLITQASKRLLGCDEV